MTITDFTFEVPASIPPGARITITNADAEAQTMTSKTDDFDAKIDPGATTTIKAPDKPGSYAFACSFHADMTGTLVVK